MVVDREFGRGHLGRHDGAGYLRAAGHRQLCRRAGLCDLEGSTPIEREEAAIKLMKAASYGPAANR
jgi:hypothetical protein